VSALFGQELPSVTTLLIQRFPSDASVLILSSSFRMWNLL
jgi:hypothetical protein